MKIGLIDVDGHNFPNLPLMKLSAYHKMKGDSVEWYEPMFSGHMDKVYMSKVFSFTNDYQYFVDADEVIKGGSGYAISTVNGKEFFNKNSDKNLPDEIEHIYPDYSLYGITNTAYGFLSRGCPRGCDFCHVEAKEGRRSIKVADLNEFWNGQKNIVLLDPNITACRKWKDLFQQLIDSGAKVDINQGLDCRLLNEMNIALIKKIKLDNIHFAWDSMKESERVIKGLKLYAEKATRKPHGDYATVYVLVNFGTTIDEDLYRIYTLRDMGYRPYVMVYDKPNAPHKIKQMQRWCNNLRIFKTTKYFEEYGG